MDVYIFQAALVCSECGEKICQELMAAGKAPEDPDDETLYDSDDFPKGPYPNGGGESDTPQHCDCGDECLNAEEFFDGSKFGCFLENPLTNEGLAYVQEKVHEYYCSKNGKHSHVVPVWAEYYDIPNPNDEV